MHQASGRCRPGLLLPAPEETGKKPRLRKTRLLGRLAQLRLNWDLDLRPYDQLFKSIISQFGAINWLQA